MTEVLCEELYLSNGTVVTGASRIYGDVATYICDSGFTLTGGDQNRTCEKMNSTSGSSYGVWSGTAPRCEGESLETNVNQYISCN